ncbi:MAG: hypothetical protein HY326_00790 [Chloroflexi bacterium]|nr:hypothetical protein [Chloroflexota bacterium]
MIADITPMSITVFDEPDLPEWGAGQVNGILLTLRIIPLIGDNYHVTLYGAVNGHLRNVSYTLTYHGQNVVDHVADEAREWAEE